MGTTIPLTGEKTLKYFAPSKLNLFLVEPIVEQELPLADTWYKLEGVLGTSGTRDFTTRGAPDYDAVFTGIDGTEFALVGDSDLSINASVTTLVEYGLFVNDELKAQFTSETNFSASGSIRSFGTNGFVSLDNGQRIDIRVKCSVTGRLLNVSNLHVTKVLNEIA